MRLSPADRGYSDSRLGERREALAKTIARNMLLPLLIALPVLSLLIRISVTRVLRPLQVLDQGPGISQGEIDRVWDRF